jgi:UDP-3-O-[3-hydroxymyristoyl] N-acetylglucosamine deacetylase
MFLQRTIRKKVQVKGIGIHLGSPCTLTFVPAPAGAGVHFVRTDLPGRPSIPVDARLVSAQSQNTTLKGTEFSVSTIEHCLGALSALRIDNLFVELDGPEIPIADGSGIEFLNAILSAGAVEQEAPRKYFRVTHPIQVSEGDKSAVVLPYQGLRLTVNINFLHPKIGDQTLDMDINEQSFTREIAPARTFGFLKDVESLRARGLALGGSLENAIVLTEDGIMNPEGLRFKDEFVRHKALDALGDLVTLTMPLLGHVILKKAGHDLMNRLVRKMLEEYSSYQQMELGDSFVDSN